MRFPVNSLAGNLVKTDSDRVFRDRIWEYQYLRNFLSERREEKKERLDCVTQKMWIGCRKIVGSEFKIPVWRKNEFWAFMESFGGRVFQFEDGFQTNCLEYSV